MRLTEQALTLDRDGSFLRAVFLKERARLYLLMGADALARTSLAQIQTEGQGRLPEVGRIGVSLLQALLAVRQGQSVEARLADLTRELGALASPLDDRVAVALVFAPLLSPGQSLDLTAPLIEETRQAELFGLRLGLLVGRVPALGQLAEAQVAMAEVLSAPAELRPACTRADVLFAHARLLAALRDPAAGPKLEAAQSALLRMAEDEVPSEHRSSFLSLPAHQRLLTFHAGPRAWQPLTDAQWAAVLPLLQRKDAGPGRPRRDTRAVLDGVLWALATGAPWNRPFPGHLPSAATCYRRYREWQASGALTEVQAHLSGLVTGHPPTF